MSAREKLKAAPANGPESELTKLKAVWSRSLSDDAREFWRSRFVSEESQSALRAELKAKLKINLRWDSQLNSFRDWVEAQDQRDLLAAKAEARKQELLAGGMTLEEAQEVLLTEAAAYSTTARDFKLGMKVSSEITKKTVTALDRDKFKEGLRTKLETGLAALAQHIKGNAKAQAAYEAFKATVTESTT